ncbi:universal stress protein [Streptomyces sp. SID3343]|uniref:universal stress protein n=1 Tax=Streptomyces sp. SID3343 TaxID=2690260 RepID=UPI0013720828|nr:universal stress protein [Streptomyces sp. SID3343]MYV99327.1 universal stress protein [Streptomyces sp. SID3343]
MPEFRDVFELGTDGPRAVLAAIDGSRTSLRAADYALGQARRSGAELVSVYVRVSSALTMSVPGGAEAAEVANDASVTEIVDYLTRRADELGVRHRFVELRGDVAREIANLADEVRTDSVVVGASEQFGHKIAGSLAVRLVRTARWPVTVIP